MTDLKDRVRRELEQLQPSTDGLERTLGRVHRRRRGRRVAAGGVGVLFAAALVVGLIVVPRPAHRPATGSPSGPRADITFEITGEGQSPDYGVWEIQPDGGGLHKILGFDQSNYWEIAWSPDGARMAYVDDLVGHYGIYTANPDGTGARRLTHGKYDRWPAWSPDGSRIAFSSHSGPAQQGCEEGADPLCPADIYVMDADGTNQRQLTNDGAPNYQPAWSPDGTRIAFARPVEARAGIYAIHVMRADGTGATLLTDDAGSWPHPSWSPDGGQIAFVGHRGDAWGVYAINPEGGNERLLAPETGSFTEGPSWSPDGTRIAFVSDRGGVPVRGCGTDGLCPPQLYLVNPDGTGLQRLTALPTGMGGVAWRPDPGRSPR